MRNIFTGIMAIAVILCSAPAYSAGPYYVGGNYSLVTEEVTTLGAPNDFEIGTLSVNGGAYFRSSLQLKVVLALAYRMTLRYHVLLISIISSEHTFVECTRLAFLNHTWSLASHCWK